MPRANRHFIPGQIWHITHRCHRREFLLIDEGLAKGNPFREDRWTESLAVGEGFVKEVRDELGIRATGRTIVSDGEQQQLRDVQQPYNGHFDLEKNRLSQNIGMEWNFFPDS